MNNTSTGNSGETLACEYLRNLGLKILERNFRIRGGEIDIVAKDGNYLVFVEVKARLNHKFGYPSESITYWKIKTLLKTAQFYIQKVHWGNRPYRIDLVSIDYTDSDEARIELTKNITF